MSAYKTMKSINVNVYVFLLHNVIRNEADDDSWQFLSGLWKECWRFLVTLSCPGLVQIY